MFLNIGTLDDDGYINTFKLSITESIHFINKNMVSYILGKYLNIPKSLLSYFQYYYYHIDDDVSILEDKNELADVNCEILNDYYIIVDNDISEYFKLKNIKNDDLSDSDSSTDNSSTDNSSTDDSSTDNSSTTTPQIEYVTQRKITLCDYFLDPDFLKLCVLLKQSPDILQKVNGFISSGSVYEKIEEKEITEFKYDKELLDLLKLNLGVDVKDLKQSLYNYHGDTNLVLRAMCSRI